MADYAYRYDYDERNRCIEKKCPGVEPVRYIYDRKGQAILSQDGNLAAGNVWAFSIPDKLGRPVLEGICPSVPGTREVLADSIVTAEFDPSCRSSYLYRHNAPFRVDTMMILQVKYYDDYACQQQMPDLFGKQLRLDINRISKPYVKGLDPWMRPVENTPRPFFGRLTGTLTSVMDDPREKVASAFYYDYEQRIVQTKTTTPAGGVATADTRYDFRGNVLLGRERSFMPGAEAPDELLTRAVYNRNGAPVFRKTVLNGGTPALVRYAYDDLNRLARKTYGTGCDTLCETYRYNIQGWLTERKSPLFEMELRYQNPDLPSGNGVMPSYTGNITQWNWRHLDPDNAALPQNSYGFSYDSQNRLTGNVHFVRENPSAGWTQPAIPMTERNLQYDLNGNVLSLLRDARGTGPAPSAVTDRLTFEYGGNKLLALDHNNLSGGAETAGRCGYSYDANGNMTGDERKGLVFRYNLLNLIDVVSDSRTRAHYTWLADGTKQAVQDSDGNGYFYSGSLVYEKRNNGVWRLESAAFDSGRMLAAEGTAGTPGTTYTPYYQLADHLGSVRTVFTLGGGSVQTVAQNDYYPFGLRHAGDELAHGSAADNRYLFNGKEDQVLGRLGLLDFGARMYDPLTTRWFNLDPLAEKYYGISPYAFCINNPVKFVDPDGRDAVIVVFPDYKISTPLGKIGGLGHAGVLLIDNKTGLTKYYEYGRYDKEEKGEVRSVRISNVTIGKDGKPTQKSLNKVMGELSNKAGKNGRIDGAYIESDDFESMNDYAKSKSDENSDPDRESYNLTGNNCGTFASDVVKQDKKVAKKAPGIIDPRPNSIVSEYQDKFKTIRYDTKKKETTIK